MSKIWLVSLTVAAAILLAGCGTGQKGNTAAPSQSQSSSSTSHSGASAPSPQTNAQGGAQRPNISAAQRQQFQQEFRSGKVVSLTGTTVTVAVQQGGADVGKTVTYTLTASTQVRKDRTAVSTGGKVPDLASLGLKTNYWVTLMVKSGDVVSVQFNSDGSQMRGFRPNGSRPPGGNQAPAGNGGTPAQ